MGRTLVRIACMTLALGATVVVSWIAVRGVSVFTGPGPFLDSSWFAVWTLQAGLAGVLGFGLGRWLGATDSSRSLAPLVLAGWFGELIVWWLLSPILAGGLSPVHGPVVWLVATGGVIQPVSAVLGGLVGKASVRSSIVTQP